MSKKKAAVIPSKGIGDALLMMIASNQLKQAGYEVTTFHPALSQLQEWFEGHIFEKEEFFDANSFDLVVAENDNSKKIKDLIEQFSKKRSQLSIFYPTYSLQKHGELSSTDHVFDKNLPMADNIATAIAAQLKMPFSKCTSLKAPPGLVHKRNSHRVIIHPLSTEVKKNWYACKYIKLATRLKQRGFLPVLVMSAKEKETFQKSEIETIGFSNLSELAAFVFESGAMIGNDSSVGHLSSNLNLPTLIISDNYERMLLWRPGWGPTKVITPPNWVPNMKPFRLREKKWQSFISTNGVLRAFEDFLGAL